MKLSHCSKDKDKLVFLFMLGLSSIIILTYSSSVEVNAQTFNSTTAKTQFNPTKITINPPIDVNTGQTVAVPGSVKVYTDPITGQETVVEAKPTTPDVEGWSIVSTESANLDSELSGALGLASSTVSQSPEGLNTVGSGLEFAAGLGLASTSGVKQVENNAAGIPTFNPPLMKCDPGTATGTQSGGFDVAKYTFSTRFDKDKLKGDDFVFQVFADLVKGDNAEIKGEDAPYKAQILTDDGDKDVNVNLKEIGTNCIDVQHAVNVDELKEIDLNKSPLFKSMNY